MTTTRGIVTFCQDQHDHCMGGTDLGLERVTAAAVASRPPESWT